MTPLIPLLNILKDPENPAFEEASTKLAATLPTFNPSTLTEAERLTLPALIEQALANIARAKTLTEAQLQKTRHNTQALQSYARLK